jgi:hypothetical protein
MPEHEPHDTTRAQTKEPVNPTVSFETEDVHVSGVQRVGLTLALVVIVVLFVSWGVSHYLMREQPIGTPELAQGVTSGQRHLPPAPRMQLIPGDSTPPPEQQREFQAAAAAELNSYGWVDAQQGVAHIPIGDAMQLLVKNGLPQATAETAKQSKPQAIAANGKKGK